MTPEDLIELERAGRRCEVCQTGRRPRQFEVVRPEGRQPIVMCPACRARYGTEPPMRAGETAVAVTATAPATATADSAGAPEAAASSSPASQQPGPQGEAQANGAGAPQQNGSGGSPPNGSGASQTGGSRGSKRGASRSGKNSSSSKERTEPREDRLRKALRELPHGEHSVARIAKAAGLNHEKTVRRLETLHAAGEVQQVGKRWSNEPPSTDIEAAMDRLQARTTNLRIVRDR
jgi:hypothetical protein